MNMKPKIFGEKLFAELRCYRKVFLGAILAFFWRANIYGYGPAFLAVFLVYCVTGGWEIVLLLSKYIVQDMSFLLSCLLKTLSAHMKTSVGDSFITSDVKSTVIPNASSPKSSHQGNIVLPFQAIPGPWPSLPIIGTNWQYFFGALYSLSDLHKANIDKYHRYGPVVKEEFKWRQPMVHLYNPDDIETMFREQGTKPVRPINEFSKYYRLKQPDKYESPGLANLVGEEWYHLRKTLAPVLLRLNSAGSLLGNMNKICDDFIALLKYSRDECTGRVDNVQQHLYRLSLEAIYTVCMEERLGCLQPELQRNTLAFALISSVKLLFEAFQELYFGLPLWKYFPTKSYRKLDEAESTIYEAASKRVQEAMENLKNEVSIDDSSEGRTPGILRKLLQTRNLSDKEVKATIIDLLSGGIFTVANAFSFLLYHLSRNPIVQDKLYQQLQEIAPDGEITSERLSKLDYLKACIKESFRLTPIIPGITRILTTDMIASGYHIPAGTPVFSNFMVACKRPDMFPNPDEFLPDRWLDSSRSKIHPFALVPFGFGCRMCVGRRFAEMEMHTALAKIMYNFKLKSTGQEINCKQDFIIIPSSPISIIFEDR